MSLFVVAPALLAEVAAGTVVVVAVVVAVRPVEAATVLWIQPEVLFAQ